MLDSTGYQREASPDFEPAADRSLAEDVMALVSDGRLLAEAELDFHKKRAIYGAKQGQKIAVHFAIAGIFAFFALMAITVGLVLALGQIITYWGSTAVVAGALLIVALIFASRGKATLARLKAVIGEGDEP